MTLSAVTLAWMTAALHRSLQLSTWRQRSRHSHTPYPVRSAAIHQCRYCGLYSLSVDLGGCFRICFLLLAIRVKVAAW